LLTYGVCVITILISYTYIIYILSQPPILILSFSSSSSQSIFSSPILLFLCPFDVILRFWCWIGERI
jgi:hypothetical protein